MRTIERLKPWMAKYDRLSLRDRVSIAAASAVVLFFVMSLVVVGPDEAKSRTLKQRMAAQKAELDSVRKDINELTGVLEKDPLAPQRAQLQSLRQTIAAADALLAELDSVAPQAAGAILREVLATSPGLELMALKTLPPALEFQSKPLPVPPPSPAPSAAPAAPDAKGAAPKQEVKIRAPRSIYRHAIEITIRGNYLALLPYLEKLQRYPGHLYWTDVSVQVQSYPAAVFKLTVYTLSGQATPRVG
jgi:MSHA biogenesis protein MshJ